MFLLWHIVWFTHSKMSVQLPGTQETTTTCGDVALAERITNTTDIDARDMLRAGICDVSDMATASLRILVITPRHSDS